MAKAKRKFIRRHKEEPYAEPGGVERRPPYFGEREPIPISATLSGTGGVRDVTKIGIGPAEFWQAIAPAFGQARQSGRAVGAPTRFDHATVKVAQENLVGELANHPGWRNYRRQAVEHVIGFLNQTRPRNPVDWSQERTIRRRIVDPVIDRR